MNIEQATDYVKASAAVLALPLDEARIQRVASHLVIAGNLARLLDDVPFTAGDELAEIFRPAPFPATDAGAAD